MNEFLYMAAKEQLLAMKTAKALNEAVRKYSNIGSSPQQGQYAEQKYKYKLFGLAQKLFAAKSVQQLPDFVESNYERFQKRLTDNILRETPTMPQATNYAELMDLFEFDTNVILAQGGSYCYIPNLHHIILDKPIHFTITWNDNLAKFESHSTETSHKAQHYIKAIRYKQTLSPNVPSTILDTYLADRRRDVDPQTSVTLGAMSNSITKLIQHTAACQQFHKEFTNEQP